MAVQPNYPAATPSLLLDFANNKRLDPRITFTRTTTATYYDGATTAKAEENLLSQSQTFTTETWSHNGISTTANTSTAPDGTTTATTITEDAALNSHLIIKYSTSLGTGTYTMSIFAKLGTGSRFLTIGFNRASNFFVSATFDLSAGTNTQTLISGYTNASATITAAAQGFYRCTVTATIDSAVDARVGLSSTGTHTSDSRGFKSYTGNGTDSLIIWGAQLEQRSSVTAYTATTTQPITNYVPVLQTASAGQARFDHNPITDESLGLLIEEARTNLLTYSEQFDNAVWGKAAGSVSQTNIGIAPDGKTTADEVTTTGGGVFRASIAVANAAAYTATVFVKTISGGGSFVFGFDANPSSGRTSFYLANGTINFNEANVTSSSITDVGNGWYRCSVTATTTSTSCNLVYYNSTSGAKYFLWGAQLEAGAFATSYIPTVAAQVTRNADAASMTGSNFTSWYNAGEGTLYAEHQKLGTATFQRVVGMSDGGFDNRIYIGYGSGNPNNLEAIVTVSGVAQAGFVVVTSSAINTSYKVATAYATNNFAGVANAGTVGTDAIGTIPVVNRLNIGIGDNTSSNPLNGTIKKLAYYPLRLTNANLQALTS